MKNKSLLFILLLSCSAITMASWDDWGNNYDPEILPVMTNRHNNYSNSMYDTYQIQTDNDVYSVTKLGNTTTARGLMGDTVSYSETPLGYKISSY
jgi:hypothetical protein